MRPTQNLSIRIEIMAAIKLNRQQREDILEAIRYRIADIHKQRQDAEVKGLPTRIYDEDEARFQELKKLF